MTSDGKLSLPEIHGYWTQQAAEHGQSSSASWSDRCAIDLEIRTILAHLADGDRVLDVGCANGYSSVAFAAQRRIRLHGLDFVAEMIEQANLRCQGVKDRLRGEVSFGVGDITALPQPEVPYDKVLVIRVLINLGSWERQLAALRGCARMLRRGGRLLLSEATIQGWEKLNRLRAEWRLAEIPMPRFNQYLDQDRLIREAGPELELIGIEDFASTYYVATRLLKPLLAAACGGWVDAANPDMEWNRWVAQLPAWGDYGTQKLFVFQKR
jgi:ubiquinone/menaquinone biosynthesis C-methylase UbiE